MRLISLSFPWILKINQKRMALILFLLLKRQISLIKRKSEKFITLNTLRIPSGKESLMMWEIDP